MENLTVALGCVGLSLEGLGVLMEGFGVLLEDLRVLLMCHRAQVRAKTPIATRRTFLVQHANRLSATSLQTTRPIERAGLRLNETPHKAKEGFAIVSGQEGIACLFQGVESWEL